jgi:hypothetical protein
VTGCEVGTAWKKSRRQVSTARKCQALSVEVEVCMGELIVNIVTVEKGPQLQSAFRPTKTKRDRVGRFASVRITGVKGW